MRLPISRQLLLAILATACFAAACQPQTPEQPGPSPETAALPAGPVKLRVMANGVIEFGGALVTREELRQRLAAIAARNETLEVHLEADRMASYGDVAAVMAIVQRAGIKAGVVGGT